MLDNPQGRWIDASGSLISSLESLSNRYGDLPDPSRPWAMHVDRRLPQMDRESKLLLSGCRFQLGVTHIGEENYDHALDEFKKSLDIDTLAGDLHRHSLFSLA